MVAESAFERVFGVPMHDLQARVRGRAGSSTRGCDRGPRSCPGRRWVYRSCGGRRCSARSKSSGPLSATIAGAHAASLKSPRTTTSAPGSPRQDRGDEPVQGPGLLHPPRVAVAPRRLDAAELRRVAVARSEVRRDHEQPAAAEQELRGQRVVRAAKGRVAQGDEAGAEGELGPPPEPRARAQRCANCRPCARRAARARGRRESPRAGRRRVRPSAAPLAGVTSRQR